MKVLLLSRYSRNGASSRLRALQYISFLESKGFEVTVSALFDEEYVDRLYRNGSRRVGRIIKFYSSRLLALAFSSRYDLIWLEKELFPLFPSVFEKILSLIGNVYIVDYDDAIFHNYDLSPKFLTRLLLGKKIDAVMRNSACVIAGNTYLAERAKAAGAPRIEKIPTVVDHTRYVPRTHSSKVRPVIGWIGSPSTQKYVVGIRDVLSRVCKQHEARLLLVGAMPQLVDQLIGIDVDVVPWREDQEADLIARMDIGIMPLPNGPWEKGKCGYKLIQYMAGAVPVVASPVGVNVQIVADSGSGLLANSAAEWESALNKLLGSVDLRNTMGLSGRRSVERHYSLQAQAPALARVFTEVINKNKSR